MRTFALPFVRPRGSRPPLLCRQDPSPRDTPSALPTHSEHAEGRGTAAASATRPGGSDSEGLSEDRGNDFANAGLAVGKLRKSNSLSPLGSVESLHLSDLGCAREVVQQRTLSRSMPRSAESAVSARRAGVGLRRALTSFALKTQRSPRKVPGCGLRAIPSCSAFMQCAWHCATRPRSR